MLAKVGATDLTGVAKLVPLLTISETVGPYGGNLTMRGVASPEGNASSEPAVSINVDGVPLSYGGAVRMANIDIGQVEVLKGPQALFFGKNSPAGVISIRSAEPTSKFESQFSAAYEFNARQIDLNGYVSGPVSDTLKLRVAGKISRQRGWARNSAPNAAFLWSPGTKEAGIRASAVWQPTSRLTVKVHGIYDKSDAFGTYSTSQKISCPLGGPAGLGGVPGTEPCYPSDVITFAPVPYKAIQAATGNLDYDSPVNRFNVRQYLISSEIEYELMDFVKLTSVTGLYSLRQKEMESETTGGNFFIGGQSHLNKSSFSEELRLTYKNPDSPIDLMFGGFFQTDHLTLQETGVINLSPFGTAPLVFPLTPNWVFPLRGRSVSAFGQVGWDFAKNFNLSAGVRYSEDKKYQYIVPPAPFKNKFTTPSVTFTNWTPEVTVSYKPNPDMNIFGSYKQAYLSGGYQIGAFTWNDALGNPAVKDIPGYYLPETVSGFEIGAKSRLFDRQLRLNLAAYTYQYKNLQLTRFDPVTVALLVINASSARVKGIEGDFTFAPRAVPGLTLTGAAAVNSSKYDSSFFGACYVGQSIAAGCNSTTLLQQFNGRPIVRAPEFSGSLGLGYETAVADNYKLTFNVNAIHTSSQFLNQDDVPNGKAPARTLVDGSISIGSESGAWEFSLIGRNLTNRFYGYSGFQTPGTGSGTGTNNAVLADYEGPISRGREIWVKVTVRPNAF